MENDKPKLVVNRRKESVAGFYCFFLFIAFDFIGSKW